MAVVVVLGGAVELPPAAAAGAAAATGLPPFLAVRRAAPGGRARRPAATGLPPFLAVRRYAVAPPAGDFYAALVMWLGADPDLRAALPGGFVQGPPGPTQPLPYADVDEYAVFEPATNEDAEYQPGFRVYASDDVTATAAADLLARKLTRSDLRAAAPWRWRDADGAAWFESGVTTASPRTRAEHVGYDRDGRDVWRDTRHFVVRAVREG